MTPQSEIESHIDEVLDRLANAAPPAGLEQRVQLHLEGQRRRFSLSLVQYVAAGALAAGVALSALVLNPAVRNAVFPAHATVQSSPRVAIPTGGGFGAAGVVHVPEQPVPVQPVPENQGRGRARSGRAVLSKGGPLPRGVLAPRAPVGVPAAQ